MSAAAPTPAFTTRHYMVDNAGILSVEAVPSSATSCRVVIRQAAGATVWLCALEGAVSRAAVRGASSSPAPAVSPAFLPPFLLQAFHANFPYGGGDGEPCVRGAFHAAVARRESRCDSRLCTELRNTEALARALKVLDRTLPGETHKFGVVYVEQGQVRVTRQLLLPVHRLNGPDTHPTDVGGGDLGQCQLWEPTLRGVLAAVGALRGAAW